MFSFPKLFPQNRPRRRRAAAVGGALGGFSVLGLMGIWIMRLVAGKAAGNPCAAANDCARNLICAEIADDAPKSRKRSSVAKLCAKPCVGDGDCESGLTCEASFAHTLGPRGGKLRERAKACIRD